MIQIPGLDRAWRTRIMRSEHALIDVDVASFDAQAILADAPCAQVILRRRDHPIARLWLSRGRDGSSPGADETRRLAASACAEAMAQRATLEALDRRAVDSGAQRLDLTVAICTRDRPSLVARCLTSIARAGSSGADRSRIDVLVVDNAPSDGATRAVAAAAGARYVVEPVPGLDFARNRALVSTDRPWIAFIDDDAALDRGWFEALSDALRRSPDALCVTGPIMPLILETEAQRRFERSGGFGKGFKWTRYGRLRMGDPYFPASAGRMGTGANMAFSRRALIELGGFDEALDTGPPLPGGGDLDAFYRVVRSGGPLVYHPDLLVYHEHRRDMRGLRRQYHSWGLALGAFARKHMAEDPGMASRHKRMIEWIWRSEFRSLIKSLMGRGPLPPLVAGALLVGLAQGLVGEYRRSRRRVALRKSVART